MPEAATFAQAARWRRFVYLYVQHCLLVLLAIIMLKLYSASD